MVARARRAEMDPDVAALIDAADVSFNSVQSHGGTQTLHWTYSPTNPDLDFLHAGDVLTIQFAAQVNDGHGNVGLAICECLQLCECLLLRRRQCVHRGLQHTLPRALMSVKLNQANFLVTTTVYSLLQKGWQSHGFSLN